MDPFDFGAPPVGTLEVDVFDTSNYGNDFEGEVDEDGVLRFEFDSFGEDILLYVRGYDIDSPNEVEVFVNGTSVGYLEVSESDNAYSETKLVIDETLLELGGNILRFEQMLDDSETWGVTEILLLDEGPHTTPLPIDPEFSEDGYVVWQDYDAFYFGKMDLESGQFLGVLNVVHITPTPLPETLQGPELILTSEGLGAVGTSEQGLVYFDANGSYLITGTEGFRIGLMPKGEVDGLRFVMISPTQEYYLYDDGAIVLLDLQGGKMGNWVNSEMFIVNFSGTGIERTATYNVVTGEFMEVTSRSYGEPGDQAAYQDEDGVQYLLLKGQVSHDLWRRVEGEWEFVRRIKSPLEYGTNAYSPEFFEYDGDLMILFYISGTQEGINVPTVYNAHTNMWTPLSEPGLYYDPEVIILSDGRLAIHYSDYIRVEQRFFTVSLDDFEDQSLRNPFGYFISQIIPPKDFERATVATKTPDLFNVFRARSAEVGLSEEPVQLVDPEPVGAFANAPGKLIPTSFSARADAFEFIDDDTRIQTSGARSAPAAVNL